jgi:hypothetical protein
MVRLFYIFGPSLLMIIMALLHLYILPFMVKKPWDFHIVWMLVGLLFTGFISFHWRKVLVKNWFFLWGSVLAVAVTLFTYLGINIYGIIEMGGHSEFPGIIIMLPTIGLLLIISVISVITGFVKRL